jgi:hypothetical protein
VSLERNLDANHFKGLFFKHQRTKLGICDMHTKKLEWLPDDNFWRSNTFDQRFGYQWLAQGKEVAVTT